MFNEKKTNKWKKEWMKEIYGIFLYSKLIRNKYKSVPVSQPAQCCTYIYSCLFVLNWMNTVEKSDTFFKCIKKIKRKDED